MTITVMDRSTAGSQSFDAFGLVARLMATPGRLYRAYHNRCAIAGLDGFSDHRLADIGLMRDDVDIALAEPIWRDPTSFMRDRALERRRGAWN